jgi:hypothetical protein
MFIISETSSSPSVSSVSILMSISLICAYFSRCSHLKRFNYCYLMNDLGRLNLILERGAPFVIDQERGENAFTSP